MTEPSDPGSRTRPHRAAEPVPDTPYPGADRGEPPGPVRVRADDVPTDVPTDVPNAAVREAAPPVGMTSLGRGLSPAGGVLDGEQRLRSTVAVASFGAYGEAAAAVRDLADSGFPVERTTIVGCDLRLVEEVTGRMTVGRAVGLAAASGAWLGALVGLLLALFGTTGALGFLYILWWSLLLGAIFGAVFGFAGYTVAGRYRGFTSDRLVVANRYDLHADPEGASALRRQLLHMRPPGMTLVDARGDAPAGASYQPAPVDPKSGR